MEQQGELLSMTYFSPSILRIIQARLENIEQRAQQLMKFISIADANDFF